MAEFTSWVHGKITIFHTKDCSDILLNRTPRGTGFTFTSDVDAILFHFSIQVNLVDQETTFATLAQVLLAVEVFDGPTSIISTAGLNNSNPTGSPAFKSWPIVPKDLIKTRPVLTINMTGSENSWVGWNAAGVTFQTILPKQF
jgi:hypothetical protein